MTRVLFLMVVERSKIISLIQNTIPQKEDIILLYLGTIVSSNKILFIQLIWAKPRTLKLLLRRLEGLGFSV